MVKFSHQPLIINHSAYGKKRTADLNWLSLQPMQIPQLHYREEQDQRSDERAGQVGALKVLQALQEAYFA